MRNLARTSICTIGISWRALRQTGTVTEYGDRFEVLRNQLLLYNPSLDEAFFVEEFMYGLRDDIRSAIHLHCPQDLDTASLLALLQEEDVESTKSNSPPRTENRMYSKFSARHTHSHVDKHSGKDKAVARTDESKKSEPTKWEERLDSLKSYHRSKGLCFTCGDKWSRTHQCPDKIPLHVIEELMEILLISADMEAEDSEESDSEDLMLLAATTEPRSALKKNTIRLQGVVGKHQILILIDSGSVASFISTNLAEKLQCATKPMADRQFTVADGHPVLCNTYVPDFEWGVQGHTFVHSVHVLNIGCYVMILWADWLDIHSPMWVHWRKKDHAVHSQQEVHHHSRDSKQENQMQACWYTQTEGFTEARECGAIGKDTVC